MPPLHRPLLALAVLVAIAPSARSEDPPDVVLAWNDLGMHCMDGDYSVFSLLPPFNTVNVHVLRNGKVLTTPGPVSVTYRGTSDVFGSLNTTSSGKTDFWAHVPALFGVTLPVDMGLAGYAMPGATNTPQSMGFDGTWDWFHAEGVPLTPIDDLGATNHYPMFEVAAKVGGQTLATTRVVAPVSNEMDCSLCHSSASSPFAMPDDGWRFDANVEKDFRMNILALHDDRQAGNPVYMSLLATAGYDAAGLLVTAANGTAILCARCHLSNALPGSGEPGVSPLTQALHGKHADVVDPSGTRLDDTVNRTSCYTCHPGSETRCLRGAMGKAVAPDGTAAMQCQSCHGTMSDVASSTRVGWLDNPSCQECHTGTATHNAGEIRFTSVFDDQGFPHIPADPIFATTADVPAAGFDLYRFSSGHGGLQCSACHGSPHAIFPALHPNDNVQSTALQGHEGTIIECEVCHGETPETFAGGPHQMHEIGKEWVGHHQDAAEQLGLNHCKKCHGADSRGTVLSLSHADRTVSSKFGTKTFWRGFQIGCYACHNGPNNEHANSNKAPVVTDKSVSTPNDVALVIDLSGTDPDNDPLTYRIVSQPLTGMVGLSGATATIHADAGYVGPLTFTFAAWDGDTNSNLGTATVQVTPAACQGSATPYGFGCPGAGDVLPTIAFEGCPTPGAAVSLTVSGGLAGAPGLLLFGLTPGEVMLAGGCVLRVEPLLAVTAPLALGATGSLVISAAIPTSATSGTATLQAALLDPAAAPGFSLSNGLELTIQ